MKICVVLLMVFMLQVSANVYSQNIMISLDFKEAAIEDVLTKIESETEFVFFYRHGLIDSKQKINIYAENKNIHEVLDQIFRSTDIDYSVKDRLIILGKKGVDNLTILQGINITGTVADDAGEPMPGVNVVIKGTTTGVVTSVDGKYSINVPDSDVVLQFSFMGYITQEMTVGDRTGIDVVMNEDLQEIEEVVVVGYGVQRKATLTGSVSSVDSKFLENRPLTNASQALQGINGVYVNQEGGQPGADNATIRIRGIGTLNDNNPLVLVDGIESSLRDVNPNDIENISVLKDAASASIYGNRAANGVILITTKGGKKEKIKVELNSYYGLQKATYLPDMVSNSIDYMMARNEASINEGQTVPYSDAQIEEYRTGTDPDLYPNSDWWNIMFSVKPIQDNYLRISGGTDVVLYSLSLGYMNQEGVLMGTDAEKYTISSNIVLNASKRLTLGANINGSYWNRSEPWSNMSGTGDATLMGSIARALPIHPGILSDGRYGDTWLVTPGHNIFRNPLFKAKEGFDRYKTQRSLVKIFAEYVFPFDIVYKAHVVANKYDSNNHRFIPDPFALINPKNPNVLREAEKTQRSVYKKNDSDLNVTFYQTINWAKRFNNHNVSLLLGHSVETFSNSDFSAYIEGFLDNELSELDAGTINKDVTGTSNKSKLISYFGRANYNYLDRYLLEMNFRYDGSSRFSKKNRWGLFPSFSAGWRIGEESFMDNIKMINNLKLRFSWGQLGNQNIALYSYLNNININQGTSFNGTVVSGSAVTQLSDPDISWETTTMTNIGLDLGLWNRLEVIIDIFDKKTKDILAGINVPAQVGNLDGPITNLYEMSNRGIEIGASYADMTGDFGYRIGGNIAFVKNNVEFLNGDIQYNGNKIIKEGYPVNSWYLYEAVGIFQSKDEVENHAFQHQNTSTGDLKYRNINDDNEIDINDKRIVGRTVPKFTYGFNLNFNYKDFDLSAFFQGVYDVDIYPVTNGNVTLPLHNGAGITKEYYNNYWTPETPNAKYPRLFLPKRGYGGNAQPSTFWLEDASYLRVKNIQFGYTLPSKWTSKVKIETLRLYFNAQNPFTFSKWKLSDPEKNIQGENIYEYPNVKIFSIGCNLVF